MSEEDSDEIPILNDIEIEEEEPHGIALPLPERSRKKYESVYRLYQEWKLEKKKTSSSQLVLIQYFHELSKKYKPSSLWSIYSMLKSTLHINENIDIKTYTNLIAFLKKQSLGFKSKKSSVLKPEEIRKFLCEAPDIEYLAVKVALIIGVCGACRKRELTYLTINDLTEQGDLLVVQIRSGPKPRSFTIGSEFAQTIKKYQALRPPNVFTDRFFLSYRKGRCTIQVIGINKLGRMPVEIATFLNLPNPESYTGHSFRRSSSALLANSSSNIITLNQLQQSSHIGVLKSYTEGLISEAIQSGSKSGNKVLIVEVDRAAPSTSCGNCNTNQEVNVKTSTASVTNEHDYGLPTGATNEKNKTLEELTNRDPLSLNETITREEEFMNAIDEINAHQKRNFAQNSWQDSTETKQDEMDVFAAGVAAKLRRLNDENLKILVQRDIDMLLYDALIGTGRYSNVARRNGNNSNLNSEMSSFSDGNIHSQVKIENDDYFETDNN